MGSSQTCVGGRKGGEEGERGAKAGQGAQRRPAIEPASPARRFSQPARLPLSLCAQGHLALAALEDIG